MSRILSIEDDADLQHVIGTFLFTQGFEVHYAFGGKEGYEKVLALHPDIILLDLMLPGLSGIEVLKLLRANAAAKNIPVIVVTAYGDDVNILEQSVKALGAVEYLRKPFRMSELVSRIKSVLAESTRTSSEPGGEISKGAFRADPKFRTVWINDRLVATLPHKSFQLLRILLESPGPVSKESLLKRLWNDPGQVNTLEKAIQRLRDSLGSDNCHRIQTAPESYEIPG